MKPRTPVSLVGLALAIWLGCAAVAWLVHRNGKCRCHQQKAAEKAK